MMGRCTGGTKQKITYQAAETHRQQNAHFCVQTSTRIFYIMINRQVYRLSKTKTKRHFILCVT